MKKIFSIAIPLALGMGWGDQASEIVGSGGTDMFAFIHLLIVSVAGVAYFRGVWKGTIE